MKYKNIIFLQESEAVEAECILNERGVDGLLGYLQQWETGDEPVDELPGGREPWGGADEVARVGPYVVSMNRGLPYYGLVRIVK